MDEREPDHLLLPRQEPHHHHESARERQRRGPMWGCLKAVSILAIAVLAVLALVIGGGYWYLGTASFADLVRLRVEKTLESRLGRKVTVRSVEIVRSRPQRVIIRDVRIANSPGTANPYFATVGEIDIIGGIDSFWGRKIKVDRVDVRNPQIDIEIYPAGSKLVHNFPHWNAGPKSRYDIVHLTIGTLWLNGATINFLDRRHDLSAMATSLDAKVDIRGSDLYEGVANSPKMTVRIQDYVPFDVDLRGRFAYTPGALALESIALHGRNLDAFVSGQLKPLTEGVYNLKIRSNVGLDRVREIFQVKNVLAGTVLLDSTLRGNSNGFTLAGGWSSEKISADVYDLANLRGKLTVNGSQTVVDVDRAQYGGGTISAHYVLPQYDEPYPMSVDLRYNAVSLDKLFTDWGVITGLRGAATGRLAYHWNKDKILEGAGEGTATLAKSTIAFSNAKYPMPIGGSADFALDNGVVLFRRADIDTGATRADFTGSLRIEDVNTDLALKVKSSDFSELDRIGYNFAHGAGKKTYTLLGLGGNGTIDATVKGRLKTPQVVAQINATGTKFNNADLGDSDIALHYNGLKDTLTFDRAIFRQAGGRLTLTGNIGFPAKGPMTFDLAVDAAGYPVEKAISVVTLPLKGIRGLGTGRMIIAGDEDRGRVTFADLAIAQGTSQLRLNGDVQWMPGKGTSRFNLDIAARSFPVAQIVEFLDLGTFPVTGELTGTLHLEGTKNALEGAGAVTVRKGSIYGEPVDLASADIAFTHGKLKATNVTVTAPAGQIKAEAELDLNNNAFSYTVQSSSIDLSKIKLLQSLSSLLGGKVTFSSSGGGTFEHPELVVTATLSDATLKGLALPPGTPPPQIYLAIRNGQLIVRGSAGDFLTIEGGGTVGANFAVNGSVHIEVSDLAKLAALFPSTSTLPLSGRIAMDLTLGGSMSALETMRIDAVVPVFDVSLSNTKFAAERPIRFGIRNGRFEVDEFALVRPGATLAVTGTAELTGQKRLDLNLGGNIDAALAQLFVPGLKANGPIDVSLALAGTMKVPELTGRAEIQGAQFRFSGFPQLIDQVTGTIRFNGETIDLEGVQALIGGGKVTMGGSITLNGLKLGGIRLTARGENVALRYFEGMTVVGTFELAAAGDLDSMRVTGNVLVDRATYSRDFDIATLLLNVLLTRKSVTPIVSATWQDRVRLFVKVSAPPGTLAIRNNIAEITAGGDVTVQGTLANPAVIGTITLAEGGRVRIQSVEYHVVSGTINFQNPFRLDPYFDVVLEGRMSNAGYSEFEQGGPIDVTINLTGTLDRLTPTITSDPPTSDITLFSLIGIGGAATTTGATSGSAATSAGAPAVGMLSQSLIAHSVLGALPFASSISYDPGFIDATEDPGPKVVFQKQASNNVRVLIIYNLQTYKRRYLLEWQVNPDWALQFIRDEVRNEYRVESRFRRRYEGHWAMGQFGRAVTLTTSTGPLAVAPAKNGPESPQPPGTGPVVNSIHWRSDAPFDTGVLGTYVSLKTGQPLSVRAVQASVKSLFATDEFRDIRVETAPEGSGVSVTFVLSLNYRVGEIHIEGLSARTRRRVERDLKIHVGEVLSLNAADRSANEIQKDLMDDGYLDATVDPEIQFRRETSRAIVTLRANLGRQATIATVSVSGDVAPFTTATLVNEMKRNVGDAFNRSQARSDARRMERYMIRRDYRKATVRYLGYDYDKNSGTVSLRYEATAGPKVRVEVVGVPRSAVRSVLPFDKNQPYSEDAVDEAANDMVKLYQRRGFFNAAVDTQSGLQGDGTWVTTFHVNPGTRFRVTAVKFTGNAGVSSKELSKVITTAPERGITSMFARLFHMGGLTQSQLNDDRDAIESYYRLKGFSDVAVATPIVNTEPATGSLTVDFPITEGPQTIVRTVKVEGNDQVPMHDLPDLEMKAGDPLNPQFLRDDIVRLQSFYAARGNAEAQVTTRPEISADKTNATVTYVIAEGPKITVGDIIVRGNTYTNSNVAIRVADLKPGAPFSYTNVLEAQRNLYRMGIFQRAEVLPEQAGTAADRRNIVLQVEEGKDLSVSGSLGATQQKDVGFSFLGEASIANRNLFGTGRYLGVDLVAGNIRQEGYLTYREPFVTRYNVPVTFNIFHSDEWRTGAHIKSRGSSVEGAKLIHRTRWSLRYEYRISDCLVEEPGDVCDLARQAIVPGLDKSVSNARVSSITPSILWDYRDDPINPHRGWFTSASVEYAFPIYLAKTQFFKEYGQISYYLPVSKRTVFAVSARLGSIQGIGTTSTEACVEAGTCVPLIEKFTGGGESSHRAYPLDLLGDLCEPPDPAGCRPTLVRLEDGRIAATGGESIFISNLEYRFPIFGAFGGSLFTDIGNVYAGRVPEFNNLRYGVGAGLHWLSPVGPLRFDVGRKLHARPYEDKYAYFLTVGYAF